MARIYSWQLTDTKYGYITGVKDNNPFIGNRLNADDYEAVVSKVDIMSLTQYTTNFNKLCELCAPYGLDPTKEGTISAAAFYDTTNLNSNFMVVLVGKDGKDGAKGEKGDKGDPGEPGVTPDTPIPYISVTAYASSGDRDIAPETPREGEIIITWNEKTKQYTFDDTTKRWWISDSDANDNDGDGSNKSIIWQSTAIYNDKGIVSPWTKPIRITGENGEPGSDGNNIEFIYTLRTHAWVNAEPPVSVNENKHVPDGWTGSPSGINDKYKYEYMCQRRKNADGIWNDWEGPTIWSRWGDDGKDGDGVEYAYLTTNGSEPNFRLDVDIDSEAYQTPEYRPFAQEKNQAGEWVDIQDGNGESIRWYDNPRQIDSEDNRAQWVIIRKRRTEEGESKAKWGEFSSPALWSMYGQKGDPGVEGLNVYERKMYQAYNVNDEPEVNAPYDFDPGFEWGTAVPVEKGDNEGIWCIEAYIKLMTIKQDDGTVKYEQQLCWYDGKTDKRVINEETGTEDYPRWSIPYIIEGRDGADFVHNREEIYICVGLDDEGKPMIPDVPTDNEKQEDHYIPGGWTQYMEGLSEETPVCYMCYRDRELKDKWWGEWSDWKGPFIYNQLGSTGPAGLDGTDGRDGEGVEYCYFLTFNDVPPTAYVLPEDYDNGNYQLPDYCPYADSDGNLRWSDEPQGVDEGNPYEWVISRHKRETRDEVVEWGDFSEPAIYAKWGFNGKDGKDIEYVYCMTKTYEKPGVGAYDNSFIENGDGTITKGEGQSDEYRPPIKWSGKEGEVSGEYVDGVHCWMDNAKDVSLEWPYQWEMIRRKNAETKTSNENLYKYPWTEYTNDIVTLHSKWGRDGDQGRQGVAGVAGIHYEMRFIRARHGEDPETGLENDKIYLLVPEIKNGGFTGGWKEVYYLNENNEIQKEWTEYWENTIHPDSNNQEVLCKERNLNKEYFPLYTNKLDVNEKYPYMFFVQSRIAEERVEEEYINENNGEVEWELKSTKEVLENGRWENPARLTGKQGIQGPEGKRGPILYSAGVYGMGVRYYTDGVKKPYVLDPNDKNYYYLEKGNYSAGSLGDDKGMDFWYIDPTGNNNTKDNTPSSDFTNNTNPYWVKMEQFDVILANVGIFRSALVGSGVFYGEWFYSQNGLSGNTIVSNYEEFDPDTKINKGPTIAWGRDNKFKPSLAMNLKDGSGWFANQNIVWDSWGNMNCNVNGNFNGDGNGSLADGAITWDAKGLYIHKDTTFDKDVVLSWGNIAESDDIDSAISAAQSTADAAKTRMDGWVSDSVITKFELQGIKDERAFIIADKNDIDKKCTKYNLTTHSDKTAYDTAYTNYKKTLDGIINKFNSDTTLEKVDVPSALTTQQTTFYSKRTNILEELVTAEQSYVSSAASAAQKAAEEYSDGNVEVMKKYAKDYTDGKVPTDEYITTITKNAITTDWLNARNITAAGITAAGLSAHTATIGTIASENIDVDNLYVKKLNTKGKNVYSAGTISVEDNEMKVYNNNKPTEVVRITGTELKDIPDVVTGCSISETTCFTYNIFNDIANKQSNYIYGSKYIGDTSSSQPNNGYKYKVQQANKNLTGSVPVTFTLSAKTTSFSTAQQISLTFCLIIDNKVVNYNSGPSTVTLFSGYNSNQNGATLEWSTTKTLYLSETPQKQYVNWGIKTLSTGASSLNQVTLTGEIGTKSYWLVPDINICDISPLGFRYIVNHEKYVVFKKDGTFFLRSGDNGVGVNNDGVFITTDGKTLQKISVSPEREFRCKGNNIKGKMLLVGTYNANLPEA